MTEDELGLEWNLDCWSTEVAFSPWGDSEADVSCELSFTPRESSQIELRNEDVELIAWTISNLQSVVDSLVEGAYAHYVAIADETSILYHSLSEEELPTVNSSRELQKALTFSQIIVHPILSSVPYIGFGLHCTWEAEHGFGVLMHGTEIVEFGDFDISFIFWNALEHHVTPKKSDL